MTSLLIPDDGHEEYDFRWHLFVRTCSLSSKTRNFHRVFHFVLTNYGRICYTHFIDANYSNRMIVLLPQRYFASSLINSNHHVYACFVLTRHYQLFKCALVAMLEWFQHFEFCVGENYLKKKKLGQRNWFVWVRETETYPPILKN